MTSSPNSAAPGTRRDPTRLLLVDDELGVRASMARVLEHAGFTIACHDLEAIGSEIGNQDIAVARKSETVR